MEYRLSPEPASYPEAVAAMERRVEDILAGREPELVWFLEHPPLYTGGTSAKASGLLDSRFPTYQTGRGGEWTYHGPGQRVAYLMLDLKKRNAMDMRAYVQNLERWIIATLSHFSVEGFTREGRIGVWVQENGIWNLESGARGFQDSRFLIPNLREAKIAALGIRVRKWVTFHGIALNVAPDLSHYNGIVPCGITGHGVTSLKQLGVDVSMREVDAVLKKEFGKIF